MQGRGIKLLKFVYECSGIDFKCYKLNIQFVFIMFLGKLIINLIKLGLFIDGNLNFLIKELRIKV